MGGGMSAEQRWAARGVVVVLALLWAALGGWAVVEGLRIRSDDMTGAGVAAAQARDDLLAALLAFQAVALVGYAVLLRVPPPPEVADDDAA